MASRFWVGGTGTWDASDTTHWASSSNGAGGQSVPGSSDTVTFDGSSGGGTVTVNTNPTITTLTTSAYTGTLDFSANNNNITISATWNDANTGVHTINMGNGNWNLTVANSNPISITAGANLTLNANSSTLNISATATGNRPVGLGAKAFNNIIVDSGSAAFTVDFNSAGNFTVNGTLTITNTRSVRFPSGGSITIIGAWIWSQTSAAQGILFTSSGPCTVSVGADNSLSWLAVQNITKAGAGSIRCNNCFNGGGNTGVSITIPGGRIIG